MTSNRSLKVVVIGAGIGGLATACALRQRQLEVEVYEAAPALGEVGAGLQLGPNAVKVLAALGFDEELDAATFEPSARVTLNWNDGSLRHRQQMKGAYEQEYGAPYKTVHRADLHTMLHRAVPEGALHLGKRCVDVQTDGGIAVASFDDGSSTEADVIIGADGIRSTVRGSLFGEEQALFTDYVAWRCIVDAAKFPSTVGPDRSVALHPEEHVAWYGPDGQILCYPIGDGSVRNVFAGHASTGWVDESWSVPSSRDELLAAFDGWSDEVLNLFEDVDQVYRWGIFDREPISEWTRGRITLLGDAAHPTMPNLAQGANMAIEDAFVVARELANCGDPEEALARYVTTRQPRTAEITFQSRANFYRTMKVPPEPPLDRSWIYSHDVTAEQE